MSQSPLSASDENTLRYQQGWRALNRLLHENRSFSGHEKNCAFLNCGPGAQGKDRPFADVSAAIGFNFPDDGRGLAYADWDFDGDLDVWTTNRTAPRVRFLRNGNPLGNHFVAFQLQGTLPTTNRDAIGARLELHLRGEKQPLVKSLHAGHAFLSQASRWVHFGLGRNADLAKLVVHWPGGEREEFQELSADKFYLVTQGQPKPVAWTPPANRVPLTPSDQEVRPTRESARIVVPPGMRLPALWTHGEDGQAVRFQRQKDGPLLVNLWASYCSPCLQELGDWASAAGQFRERGVEVVAFNTDRLAGAEDANGKAAAAVERTNFPFSWYEADARTVRNLDAFTSAVLDLWIPLPVPSSFLVDADDEVIAIYKGPVSSEQVLQDLALATATPEVRRDAAVPFPGRWVGSPTPGDSLRVASQLLDRDDPPAAIRYLDDVVADLSPAANDEAAKRTLGDNLRFLGTLLEATGRKEDAVRRLEAARDALPKDIRIRTTLGSLYHQTGKLVEATREITAAITMNPADLTLHDQLAGLYTERGDYERAAKRYAMVLKVQPKRPLSRYRMAEALLLDGQGRSAVAQLKQSLTLNPRFLDAANLLAQVLASHPDPALRSPREAFALATRLCQETGDRNPRFLETSAIAAAALGNFDLAVARSNQALSLYQAQPQHDAAALKTLEERLAGFRQNAPWIENKWKSVK